MIYGLVSEFNPFHNGHKWLIDKVKTENDTVVTVMSSSFVQRGDISIISKMDRTFASLKNGVDLVLELPSVYSLSSAEDFGKSSIEILKGTNIIDKVVFGSECGDVDLLKKGISALKDKNVQKIIKENMNKGVTYPKAIHNSILELYSDEIANLFDGSNNILGMEYLKSLENSNISAITFSRKGAGHNDKFSGGDFASGSYIRDNYSSRELYTPKYPITDTAKIENIEKIILYKLSSMTENDLRNIPDVQEGFENRIIKVVQNTNNFNELCEKLKTKRYTMSRIRRIICRAILGIDNSVKEINVPYIRVLGFTEKGSKLLKEIKENGTLPLITNVKTGYDNLDNNGKKILGIENLATRLWSLASCNNTILNNEFTQQIIKG